MLIWSANSWILNSYAWPTKNNIHLPTHMTEEYGSDEYFMRQALAQAQMASERGEIPVGVVITGGGRIIARGHNMTETLNDVTAHAEMQAITSAAQSIGGKYLAGCTLYVTLEPCSEHPIRKGAIARWALHCTLGQKSAPVYWKTNAGLYWTTFLRNSDNGFPVYKQTTPGRLRPGVFIYITVAPRGTAAKHIAHRNNGSNF